MPDRHLLDQFNLNTMSGIYPGERPAIYQRFPAIHDDRPDGSAHWFRLSWDQQPPGPLFHSDEPQANAVDRLPRFRLAVSDPQQACILLACELAQRSWTLHTCGTCAYWHRQHGATAGDIAAGRCGYRSAELPDGAVPLHSASAELTVQSALSMACGHWAAVPVSAAGVTAEDHLSSPGAPMQPEMSESQSAPSLWRRLQALLLPGRRAGYGPSAAKSIRPEKVTAVGAEPCFACQGRIARLGSLTLAAPNTDTETFTIWRCHACYTTYLGDWIDRWVRLDSLETEETLYRVVPADAAGLLEAFQISQTNASTRSVDNRGALEARLRSMTQDLEPLSHQVKLGR